MTQLDLSLPGMPGAFVFEPSETVDSAQGHRGRGRPTRSSRSVQRTNPH